MTQYPPVSTLLPHRPPMLLVDAITRIDGEKGEARALIPPQHLFLRGDGTLSPEVYCELFAQGFGACEAYRRQQKGLTLDGGGYLASMREVQIFQAAHSGDELLIRTQKTDECFDTYIVQGEIFRQDTKLAQGTIYIFMWRGKTPPQVL